MSETWPDCVDTKRFVYICPKCGTEIPEPGEGKYVRTGQPYGPDGAEWEGFAFNQLLKGPSELREIWGKYQRQVLNGLNPSEFFNGVLGQTHRDPNAVLVSGETFDKAIGADPSYRCWCKR